MTWTTGDSAVDMESAIISIQQQYPGKRVEVLQTFDIAWAGWECDSKGALLFVDGNPELCIVDRVTSQNVPDLLEERAREYRRLANETEAALRSYRRLGGKFGPEHEAARKAATERVLAAIRHDGENDDQYQARMAKWGIVLQDEKVVFAEEKYRERPTVTAETINTIDTSRRPALAEHLRDEFADRKALLDNGGGMVFDVENMPIEDVREILSSMDILIDLDQAAGLLNTSTVLVLHRVNTGRLHLLRREVVALYEEERPQREALEELARLGEAIEDRGK